MLNNSFLLPSSYFAPISYYSIIYIYPESIIERHEYFVKQTIRNRCSICCPNGILNLSIPRIRKNSSKTLIKDIQICYTEPWQKIHWKTIKTCYNSSPFFEYYMEKIHALYQKKEKYLIDFNHRSHRLVLDLLESDQAINYSQKYDLDTPLKDYRKYSFNNENIIKYDQVFSQENGFINNLSIIDLIFNLGAESDSYLKKIDVSKIY